MILVIIITSISVISALSIPQKVMAHILSSEERAKVLGDDQATVHSSIPYQLMLVLAVTVIITIMVARVQRALVVKGPGQFSSEMLKITKFKICVIGMVLGIGVISLLPFMGLTCRWCTGAG
jgi:uncharacterized membrane protein